jgi:hypothetical protein
MADNGGRHGQIDLGDLRKRSVGPAAAGDLTGSIVDPLPAQGIE